MNIKTIDDFKNNVYNNNKLGVIIMEQSIIDEIIDNHYYDYYKSAMRCFYREDMRQYYQLLKLIPNRLFPEVLKFHNNYRNKFKRVHSRIRSIVAVQSCFLTLTFSDAILSKTSKKTRREYISKYLKQFPDYIGNIDFGAQNGREHYHAVVQVREVDLSTYPYGFIFSERIRCKEDSLRLSRYIKKLTFHAMKTNERILTKRNRFKLELVCDFNQPDYYDKDFINDNNVFKE